MMRQWHRWLALITLPAFLIIVLTGCLLQIKRWIPAIQPESKKSSVGSLEKISSPVGWEKILSAVKGLPEANVQSWNDVKTLDVRPALGVARVRTKSGYEVQVDLATGESLSSAMRYSSLLIEIHEGAFFGDFIRNKIFVPTAFLLIFLTFSGLVLLIQHYRKKWRPTWSQKPVMPSALD
jgi:uncharacterized iron-regulated membrane protein